MRYNLSYGKKQVTHVRVNDIRSLIYTSGCDKLAAVEEDIVIAFIPAGGENVNRLAIILNKAYQVRSC